MNEQNRVRRDLPSQASSKRSGYRAAAGVAVLSIILTVIGAFAIASFAIVETRTLIGGETLNLLCDGRGFQAERPSATEMVLTCRAAAAVPTVAPTTAPVLPPQDCNDWPQNGIKNHSFEDSERRWSFYSNGTGTFSVRGSDGHCAQAAHLRIDSKGSNVQLYQAGLKLDPNTEYVVRFRAKSETGSDLAVNILKHKADYRNYGLKNFEADLTPQWQTFEVRFTTIDFPTDDSNGRLQFWLAPYAKSGDQYWIDQVQVLKAADAVVMPPDPIVQPTVAPIVLPPETPVGTFYVAPNGNDSNPGTEQAPFRTIQHAVNQAEPGNTIYVRDGTYVETVRLAKSGTAENPITLSAYPGENPVIDGAYRLPDVPDSGWAKCNTTVSPPTCFHYRPLVDIAASHIVFTGFEVRHSLGRGVWVHNPNNRITNIVITNNAIHDHRNAGVKMLRVDNVTFDANRVWHISNYATHDRPGSELGWTHAVNALESSNVTYSNNEIFNNYGEGIGTGRGSDRISIVNNEIYDNRALNVYIHRTTNAEVRQNNVYCTGNTSFLRGGNRPAGIVVNNEDQFSHMQLVNNAQIVENFVVGCSRGFAMWAGGGTVKVGSSNVLVERNIFVNQDASPGTYEAVTFSIMPKAAAHNVLIRNNVIHQQKYRTANVPDEPQLKFENNMWSQPPPDSAQGAGDTYGQIELVDPDILIRPGQFDPGAYQPVNGTILGN